MSIETYRSRVYTDRPEYADYDAVADLEQIRPYEPNVVKAAWNIFGDSYRYRQQYNAYKTERREREKQCEGQLAFNLEEEEYV